MSATFTLIIGRKSFEKALAIVKRVAPTRAPKPSLCGALLQVNRGRVTLSATNLEHSVTVTLEHYGLLGDLTAKALLDIPKATALVKGADGETIELNGVADDTARIGKADITSAYSALAYPVIPTRNAESSLSVNAKALLLAIDRTAFACDADSTRYSFGGALLEFKPDDSGSGWGDVALVATDGKRLAKQALRGYVNRNSPGAEFDPSAEVSTFALPTAVRPVVPLAVLKIIGPLAKAAGKHDEAWFSFTPGEEGSPRNHTSPKPGTSFVRLGNIDVYTRLAEGRFPQYEDCSPTEVNATALISDHTAIGDAMKQAKPFRPEGHNGVDIVTGGNLGSGVFGVYVPQGRETLFSAEVPAQCSGTVIGMTIDPSFLAEAMRGLGTKPVALTMELVDDKTALALRTADGWHYLAMPLTQDGETSPEKLPPYWPGAKAEVAAQDEAEAGAGRMLAENGDDSTEWAECWIDEGDGPDTAPIIGGTDGRDFRCRACLRPDDSPVHGDSDPDCHPPTCKECGAVMVPEGAHAPDPLLYAILRADLPPVRNPDLRKERRTVWAKAIRRLLADLGIKGVSITTPHYSMAHSIDVKLPAGTPHDRGAADHEYRDCPMCQERNRAQDRITQIILAAFPDLDDRSDSMTDYFDFCLSVG
jgi:DNA polymerase III sliding clamp (beta) subunit (PCNA family)